MLLFNRKLSFLSLWMFITSFSTTEMLRIDCHPDNDATSETCGNRGCVWNQTEENSAGIPFCYFQYQNKTAVAGYDADFNMQTMSGVLTRRPTPSIFGKDYSSLSLHIATKGPFLRLTMKPKNRKRSKMVEIRKFPDLDYDSDLFDVSVTDSPFGFLLRRKSNRAMVLDSRDIPGLTFSEQYIQFSVKVPTDNFYGIGEQFHSELKRKFDWRKLSLFTRDHEPKANWGNLYGFHPFGLGLDANNQAYGIFFNNPHGMNVQFQPDPHLITFRVIGGDVDVWVFFGPTPDNVIQQYTQVIGRPMLPPYWSLGFQLCRYGYRNLTYLKKVWKRNRDAGIPQDVQFIDIDYMDKRKDFTYSKDRFDGLPAFVEEIHKSGRKLTLIVDPAIANNVSNYPPLDQGLKEGIFILDGTTKRPLVGRVWPGTTYWPDFSNPKIIPYWTEQNKHFHSEIHFDGIWLDMNDPSNFVNGSPKGCSANSLNYPPYSPVTYSPLYQNTICLDSVQHLGYHYEWHNYYGHFEIIATYHALEAIHPNERPFILSRSSAPGSGRYACHWTGDNTAVWSHLNASLIKLMEFNMFGIPMVGADICGFNGDTTEELCLRWSQLGAFYPYSRNHNDIDSKVDQDPGVWPRNTSQAISAALHVRYALLPYLYTLLYRSHIEGSTVARPLFFDFPEPRTFNLHDQLLWGSHLMIVPILKAFTVDRKVFYPKGIWYNVNDGGRPVPHPQQGRTLNTHIPKTAIGLFLRGGGIIPYQLAAETTRETRKNPLGVTVSLGDKREARGELFWDDGISLDSIHTNKFCLVDMVAANNTLHYLPSSTHCPSMPELGFVQVAGVTVKPKRVTVDGVTLPSAQVIYSEPTSLLVLVVKMLDPKQEHTIKW